MKCNVCWDEIKGQAYVTRCHHCFCERDARKAFSESMECPACNKALSRRDIKDVQLQPSDDFKTMALCGFPPDVISDMCHSGLQFWAAQQEILVCYEQYMRKKTEERMQQLEKECEDKAVAAESERRRQQSAAKAAEDQLETQRREHRETQERLSAATREKAKIYELYNQLKRKHEKLLQDMHVHQLASVGLRAEAPGAESAKRPRHDSQPFTPFRPFAPTPARATTASSAPDGSRNDRPAMPPLRVITGGLGLPPRDPLPPLDLAPAPSRPAPPSSSLTVSQLFHSASQPPAA